MCSIIWLKLILVASEVVRLQRLLMSWEVVHTASIRLLMLYLLTCMAYLCDVQDCYDLDQDVVL